MSDVTHDLKPFPGPKAPSDPKHEQQKSTFKDDMPWSGCEVFLKNKKIKNNSTTYRAAITLDVNKDEK